MWLFLIATAAARVSSEPCQTSLQPPSVPPIASDVYYGSLYDGAGGYDEAPLGIGRLALDSREDLWDWWLRIAVPLFDDVGGSLWGWYVNGSLVETALDKEDTPTAVAIGTSGMIETGYETMTFIVVEQRDGWLRFRYARPSNERSGLAWTPSCRVEAEGLRFETWEERFTSGEISVLTFRSEIPHALRAAPGVDSERIRLIAGSHHLEALEFRGDWMRVRVTEPSDYCAGGTLAVRQREGWIQWRSEDKGPWVWYFTRGC